MYFVLLHAYGEAGDCNFTYPVSLTEQSGAFVLKDGMKIGVSDQSLFPAAGYLQDILRNVVSTSVEVTEADKADIYLQLGQDNGKPGSYKLQATPKSVQVEAGDYSGIVSAIASLHQLLPAGIEVQGTKQTFSIPAVQIEDSPRFDGVVLCWMLPVTSGIKMK